MASWHFSTSPGAEPFLRTESQNNDLRRHFVIASLRCRSLLSKSTYLADRPFLLSSAESVLNDLAMQACSFRFPQKNSKDHLPPRKF